MSEKVKEENTSKKTSGKKITIIIIIFLCLVLIGGGYLLSKGKNKNSESNKPEEINNKYSLPIYECESGYLSEETGDYCLDIAFEIPTETKDAKVYQLYNGGEDSDYKEFFILYSDNGLKIYNISTKEIQKVNLKDEYEKYKLNVSHDNKEAIGIVYENKLNDDSDMLKNGYYIIKENKKIYEDQYESLYPINENYIQAYIDPLPEDEYDRTEVYLLDAKKENIVRKENEGTCKDFDEIITENGSFIAKREGCTGGSIYTFYTEDFKLIAEDLEQYEYDFDDDNNLYLLENNKAKIYNAKGKIIKEYNLKGKVQHLFKDFYLTIDNQKLMIYDYKDFSVKLRNWNSKNYYHWMISGYYKEYQLENEEEKKAGYYLIVEEYDEGPGVEYFFEPATKKVYSWKLEYVGGYAKPILYLYPEKETEVEINFEHEDKLTTTYPKFKDSWQVTAKPNGDLYDKDGKYYYGLYWEEEKNHTVSFNEGFYVTKENAITFLEEKLSIIGLNERERNEFIMYWLPILENNGQSLVYFELTEEREQYNKINISPAPDSLLRIAIHVKKVNSYTKIKEQKLTSFKRQGFTAVEWGGVLYK